MKVVISGYGKMGRMVESILVRRGIECVGKSESIQDFVGGEDAVCIDFTTPAAFRENYRFLASHFKGVVVGTTGWNDIKEDVFAAFREAGTPMIYASNFSIGVNVLFDAVERIASLMGNAGGYEPYIVEMHHKHKLDAPSGTAATLSAIVSDKMGVDAMPVESVRCGEIAGIHEVGFEGLCDRLTIRHEAFSREGFAAGAVRAAEWCDAMTDGVYEFRDLLK